MLAYEAERACPERWAATPKTVVGAGGGAFIEQTDFCPQQVFVKIGRAAGGPLMQRNILLSGDRQFKRLLPAFSESQVEMLRQLFRPDGPDGARANEPLIRMRGAFGPFGGGRARESSLTTVAMIWKGGVSEWLDRRAAAKEAAAKELSEAARQRGGSASTATIATIEVVASLICLVVTAAAAVAGSASLRR
jgi:hypothetical protein